VLNQPRYQGASSPAGAQATSAAAPRREHAPWALQHYGFRARRSRRRFADIFFNNCFKNGAAADRAAEEPRWTRLFDEVARFPGYALTIDLPRAGGAHGPMAPSCAFEVEPFRKYCLLNGFDDIGLTLRHADKIRGFEAAAPGAQPWLAARDVA
jgi:3-isopropylmalate/(R)-2-methylmalate dehydratase small subunit